MGIISKVTVKNRYNNLDYLAFDIRKSGRSFFKVIFISIYKCIHFSIFKLKYLVYN